MNTHPDWCQVGVCTAYDTPAPSLRAAHRGPITRVDAGRGGITVMLIQDRDDSIPKVVVTAAGWAHSRMVELGPAGVQQLVDHLGELLGAVRRETSRR